MAVKMLQCSLAAVACLLFIALTTPISHIAAFLSRYKRLRTVIEMMLLTYRVIFIILLVAEEIYVAQQSRLGYYGFKRQIKALGLLAAAVAKKSFISIRDINQALGARNYQKQLVFRYSRQPVSYLRLFMVACLLGLIVGLNIYQI